MSAFPTSTGGRGVPIRILLWIFCCAFAFDFRGEEGGSGLQLAFLGAALVSGGMIVLSGLSLLRVRPGGILVLLWWGYLISTAAVVLLNHVETGRYLRVIIPFVLCGLALAVAQIVACRGLTAREIITPILVAAVINVVWRAFYGFAFSSVTIEDVRVEILSPGLNWLMAYIGCALALRPRMRFSLFALIGLTLGVIFLSVTRGPLLPMMASGLISVICLILAVMWRIIPLQWAVRRTVRLASVGALLLAVGGASLFLVPVVRERWEERLFDHAGGVTSKDVSWLSREAEAKAMWDILSENPLTYVYGNGVGATYYWDQAYYPELHLVYGEDYDFTDDSWFAGHSTWTFALFSGGAFGVVCTAALFAGVIILCFRSVYVNRRMPGFRVEYAFLPVVAAFCLLSETATSNPFDERLSGLIFGMMCGLPQVLFNRAYSLRRDSLMAAQARNQAGIESGRSLAQALPAALAR